MTTWLPWLCLALPLVLVYAVMWAAMRAARRWEAEQEGLCRWRMTGVGLSDKELHQAELRAIRRILEEARIPPTDERWQTLAEAEEVLEHTSDREAGKACLEGCACVVCGRQRREEAA